jgi:hypothetical protein
MDDAWSASPGLPKEPTKLDHPPQTMSHNCFQKWVRHDRAGLEKFAALNGKLRVRVPVPRQRWPEPTVGGE